MADPTRYELMFTGAAEVERAVWHRHGDEPVHFHTAEEYKKHEPILDEQIVAGPEED
jgi:hypothetical protein